VTVGSMILDLFRRKM